MASIIIRKATVKDIPSIVSVRLGTLTEEELHGFSAPEFAYTSSMKEMEKTWDSGNMLKDGLEVFVAEDEDRLVGYMMFKIKGDSGYIDDVVVAREEQARGIGRALVAYVESIAKSKGCSFMKTDTTENAAGIAWRSYGFWTRMGYEDTGERLPTNYDFKEIPFIKKLK